MKQLSEEQMAAVNAVNGPILVVSCPGSGKTTTLIARIKHMLDCGISPASMLNITFTKAAAEEMANRFAAENGATVKFSTIHAFCFTLLCREFGMTRDSLLTESEKWIFLCNWLSEYGGIKAAEAPDMATFVMQEISYVKNKEFPVSTYRPQSCKAEVFAAAYEAYEEYKENTKKVDFDDMLILTRDNLVKYSEVLEKYRSIYQYISIDEFQDVNKIQADIAYLLAGENGNLFVVGDDDQSIYRFRAADSNIMLNFSQKFPNSKIIYMGTNYRSGKNIVALAGRLIQENRIRFPKEFKAFREESGKVFLAAYDNDQTQAKTVTEQIKKMFREGAPYESMAILYRTNSCAIPFLAEFLKEDIPFYTSEVPQSHHGFIYEEILAYYRLSRKQEKRDDLQKILNSPSRYLTARCFINCPFEMNSMLKCCDKLPTNIDAAKSKIFDMLHDIRELSKLEKPSEFIEYLSTDMGYREDLVQKATFHGKPQDEFTKILGLLAEEASEFDRMEDWMQYVLYYERKLQEARKNKTKKGVCLSTFHSSKGLEWENVFVVNANDGQTPFFKAETAEELEEERRMFYVAITRAKDNLYMSYIDNEKSLPTPYFDDMGLLIKNVGKGSTTTKLDPVNGLG